MSYEIEKGIPVAKSGAGRRSKYPFAEMKVGDSILVRDCPVNAQKAAYAQSKRLGVVFRTRTVNKGVRIWRIA
ncbi:MAG: hypothetical protein ACM34A_12090 [Bacillota bacterium]